MELFNLILLYWFVAGIISIVLFNLLSNKPYNKEKINDLIADITWQTGIHREHVISIINLLLFCLGGIFLLTIFAIKIERKK